MGDMLETVTDSYTKGRAGPTRGSSVETREVRGVSWQPAKAPMTELADLHKKVNIVSSAIT
jgi:hypothetical protein